MGCPELNLSQHANTACKSDLSVAVPSEWPVRQIAVLLVAALDKLALLGKQLSGPLRIGLAQRFEPYFGVHIIFELGEIRLLGIELERVLALSF